MQTGLQDIGEESSFWTNKKANPYWISVFKSSSDGIRTRVFALGGRRPRPLDNGARNKKAGELGFEPRQYESES